MIEFNGYITGEALDFFKKKIRNSGLKIWSVSVVFAMPLIIFFFKRIGMLDVFAPILPLWLLIPLLALIPKGKNELRSITPNRIYTEDNCIICSCDSRSESRLMDDVSKVYDYGDFYFIAFVYGKFSDNFICQKDLLTSGTLEDFEELFAGKIHKV